MNTKEIIRKEFRFLETNYIRPTLNKRQNNKCNFCYSNKKLELHHKRYELDININDYYLICHKCHRKILHKHRK